MAKTRAVGRKGKPNPVISLWQWTCGHWKAVGSAAIVVAVFVPGPYRWFIDLLPTAHYYLGDFADPPAFIDRPVWKIELQNVEQAPPAEQLDRLLSSFGRLAHLPDSTPYVPAHNAASEQSQEAVALEWSGKQCLYIKDVELVLMDETIANGRSYSSIDPEGPRGPHGAVGMPASELKRRAANGASRAATYLALLPSRAKTGDCRQTGEGKACPRIAVWAYGSLVPCSLSLIDAIIGLWK